MVVCWEVKAVRNDAFVRKSGTASEVEKSPNERGKYLFPAHYGRPESEGINSEYQRRKVPAGRQTGP